MIHLKRAFHYRDSLIANGEPIEHYIVSTMGHPFNVDGFSSL